MDLNTYNSQAVICATDVEKAIKMFPTNVGKVTIEEIGIAQKELPEGVILFSYD
jgi:hypothetical protein